MSESNFMHVWEALLGSLAMIALILTALGLMVGTVKSADAPKRVGAILGIVIVLMLAPGILANAWSGMSMWQQIALVGICAGTLMLLRPRRRTRSRERK